MRWNSLKRLRRTKGKSGQIVEIVGLMALDAESVTGDLNIE